MTSNSSQNQKNGTDQITEFNAVVVGAGFSGMYMLHSLRELGLTTRVFEGGSDVGGTWYWNRYPGLKCDTESLSYSFTFSKELYQKWTWSSRFAPQQELLRYANYIADKFDLRKDIQFNKRVMSAHFDEANHKWQIHLDDGRSVTAKYFITGTGPLSSANVPKVKGLESFKGEWYHTGRWPHEKVDFKGKRVAVIGTGSSGVQIIGAVAKEADHLTVFQRTPQYITPAQDRRLDPDYVREIKDNFDDFVRQMRNSSFGAPGAATDRSIFEDTPEERQRVFEAAWQKGAQAFALGTYNDLNTNEEANKMAADFVRSKIAQIVHDPKTAAKLMPTYLFGTKRPVKADGYYEIYNRENVDLVDLRETPIEQITPTGIRTSDGEYELDMIVFATGFDAITGTLFKMDIRGKDGITLREKWKNGAQVKTYLGVATNGFPNMFTITGPQSPSVLANYLFGIQQHVDWITEFIHYLNDKGIDSFEAESDAEVKWSNHCQELAEATFLTKTKSWWSGGNIEGKPSSSLFTIYLGGVKKFAEILNEVAEKEYEGFVKISTSQTTMS
ncbi:NAD(P)/FAD-dependent oxidoreductase [Neobacillus niacini]|uniref:flavin-containing monooxygenase n=1 Tax=Neobacillus niacini TaxID=86668 RepID=UPI0030011908